MAGFPVSERGLWSCAKVGVHDKAQGKLMELYGTSRNIPRVLGIEVDDRRIFHIRFHRDFLLSRKWTKKEQRF
jgi:hypothetical protein